MDTGNPLSKLLFDNTSGSSALLDQLTGYLINDKEIDSNGWKQRATNAIDFGKKELQQFQIVQHFLESLETEFPQIKKEKDLKDWVESYLRKWASVPEQWVHTLRKILSEDNYVISTHSQSESLKAAFLLLSKEDVKMTIYQTQSSPANEGELQANWLANKGIEVILTTDALAPTLIQKCDFVIFGCDGIYSDGFVNKAGSLSMCLAAVQYGKPVYVLADTRKISHTPAPEEEGKPSVEVTTRTHPNLEVLNLYFEVVPHNLVTGYITEKGILEENI